MAIPTEEFARRVLLRVLAQNTEVVRLEDDDPNDTDEDPTLVRVTEPSGILKLKLFDVGLTNQGQVEIFRAELRNELPIIDGELTAVKLSSGTVIGKLRNFIRAGLDMKLVGGGDE